MPAEERAGDGRVPEHRVGVAGGDDAADVERHEPLRDGAEQRDVVLDHEEAGAEPVTHLDEEGRQRLRFALRDAARRLVEEQHRRLVRERAREVDDAARAGRQLVHERVDVLLETEQRHELVGPARDGGFGAPGAWEM